MHAVYVVAVCSDLSSLASCLVCLIKQICVQSFCCCCCCCCCFALSCPLLHLVLNKFVCSLCCFCFALSCLEACSLLILCLVLYTVSSCLWSWSYIPFQSVLSWPIFSNLVPSHVLSSLIFSLFLSYLFVPSHSAISCLPLFCPVSCPCSLFSPLCFVLLCLILSLYSPILSYFVELNCIRSGHVFSPIVCLFVCI